MLPIILFHYIICQFLLSWLINFIPHTFYNDGLQSAPGFSHISHHSSVLTREGHEEDRSSGGEFLCNLLLILCCSW